MTKIKKKALRGISFVLICCILVTLLPTGVAVGYGNNEEIIVTSTFTTMPMVMAGQAHTVALRNDGTVWAWGANSGGQLGDGTIINRYTPVQVQGLSDITDIATSGSHTVALRNDGTVWAWGSNSNGQIGDGTTINRYTPVQVQGVSDITDIAASGSHTVALRNDGTVWAWGHNGHGRLGDGTTTDRHMPIKVNELNDVTAIASGGFNTFALCNEGTVWAWGINGRLGEGATGNSYVPMQVQGLNDVITIEAGGSHAFALKDDGALWAWGQNNHGQLGDGTVIDRRAPIQIHEINTVLSISGNNTHSIAVNGDGTVWTWGSNSRGQLGTGVGMVNTSPIQVQGLNNVTAITAGSWHSAVLQGDGTVWAWGDNSNGQLGNGATSGFSLNPVQVLGEDGIGYFNVDVSTPPIDTDTTITLQNTTGIVGVQTTINGIFTSALSANSETISLTVSPAGAVDFGQITVEDSIFDDYLNVYHQFISILITPNTAGRIMITATATDGTTVTAEIMVIMPPYLNPNRRPFVSGVNNFSFTNYPDNFLRQTAFRNEDGAIVVILNPQAGHTLTEPYYSALLYHNPLMTDRYRRHIRFSIGGGWGGSCAGMAWVSALTKAQELTPSFFQVNPYANNLYELRAPRHNSDVANLITYYQFLQNTPALNLIRSWVGAMDEELQLRRIVDYMLESDYPVYIGFRIYTDALQRREDFIGGHAVLGHHIIETEHDYRISVWDPNRLYETRTILIIDRNEEGGLSNARFEPSYRVMAGWPYTRVWLGLSVDYLITDSIAEDWNIQNILSRAGGRNHADTIGHNEPLTLPNELTNCNEHWTFLTTNTTNFTIASSSGLSATLVDGRMSGTLDIRYGASPDEFGAEVQLVFILPNLTEGETYTITPHNNNATFSARLSYGCYRFRDVCVAIGFAARVEARGEGSFTFGANGSVAAEMASATHISLETVLDGIGNTLYTTEVFGETTSISIDIDTNRRKIVSSDTDNLEITLSGSFADVTFPNVDVSSDITVMHSTDSVWLVNEDGDTLSTRNIPGTDSPRHTIQLFWNDGGSAVGGGVYTVGSDITITVRPDNGYVFLGWYEENGGRASQDLRYTFTVSGDRTLIARFAPLATEPPTIPVIGISIAGAVTRNLTVNQLLQLTAIITPANATNQNVIWSSSNTNVVRVSATGQITAVSVGTATITVRTEDGNHIAMVTITVTTAQGGNDNNDTGYDSIVGGNEYTGGQQLLPTVIRPPVQAPEKNLYQDYELPNEEATAYIPEIQLLPIPPVPPPRQFPFTDAATTAWYYPYVRTVWERDIFQGTAQNRFSPQESMTRAMFVQMLANHEGINTTGFTTSSFNDVGANAWYFGAVEWAVQMGIVEGVGNGNFEPSTPITREQMTVMLYRYANIMGIELSQGAEIVFTDKNTISDWAVSGVNAIQRAGIITGRPDGNFDPQETATRAEVAALFVRFLDVIE